MPQQLEYDEQGSTFYYFLISFYGLILLPATYFLWPTKKKEAAKAGLVCHCDPCRHKRVRLEEEQPRETLWVIFKLAVISILWLLLFFMLYKVMTAEVNYEEYDPFSILELESDATMSEIRKQYRKLSKVYHPDKEGGDQQMFMKIAKAYEALTDEVSRENWMKYGNPDGPQAATFGIALPSWVVEKQNSVWVLGIYLLIFIIVLPVAVGTWWYRSIKYTTANLLIQTTQVFFHFLSKPKQLNTKKLLMVLTAAFEFNPQFGKVIQRRPSDNEELNELIQSRNLPHLMVKVKEPILKEPWVMKASILLHAHLGKVRLSPLTLCPDQRALLKLCPQLISEMINILNQVWVYAKYRPSPQVPTVPNQDVFESVMRVSQMIVQQMWERDSVLLQLPHIQSDMLKKHFKTRRRNITNVEDFVAMKNDNRRSLVRALSDEDYLDVMAVCSSFPHITISTETLVMDDDDRHKVTAGSMVTVTVTLKRVGLLQHYDIDPESLLVTSSMAADNEDDPVINNNTEVVETVASVAKSKQPQRPAWEKTKKKKKGKAGAVKSVRKRSVKKGKEKQAEQQEDEEEEVKKGSQSEEEEDDEEGAVVEDEKSVREVDEEEEEWQSLQETMKVQQQKKKEAGANKESHPVHAPFFPDVKQEGWWLYIVEQRKRQVVVLPQRVVGLKTELTQDLQFQAPEKPCVLRYSVVLTSDSYLNLQFSTDLKIDVNKRVEVKGRSQWAELEQEEEEEEAFEETDSGDMSGDDSDSAES